VKRTETIANNQIKCFTDADDFFQIELTKNAIARTKLIFKVTSAINWNHDALNECKASIYFPSFLAFLIKVSRRSRSFSDISELFNNAVKTPSVESWNKVFLIC